MLKTFDTKRNFVLFAFITWCSVPLADALSKIIYLALPHDPNADSPGLAIYFWLILTVFWIVISPILFAPVVWVAKNYQGSKKLFLFNKSYYLRSICSYIFLIAVPWVIFILDLYYFTIDFYVHSIPLVFSTGLLVYLFTMCHAEIVPK